jgi:ribose 5-phosphate isomerase A
MNVEEQRRAAGQAAAALVQDGMVVGLGTGRTAAYAIEALAGRKISGVPTSVASAELARKHGIPLRDPPDEGPIDLTIDGADEFDAQLRLIKGGGGALTREKVVARASRFLAIVADADKQVARLGTKARLPVEVLEFGLRWTLERLWAIGLQPRVRAVSGRTFVTDGGNRILDCLLPTSDGDADLEGLARAIKSVTGVVEHGLFLDEADCVLLGRADGVQRLDRAP